MSTSNPKARAWDALGLKYYFLGRRSGKPTRATIRWFTGDLAPDSRCLVVGGTSVGVVKAAIATRCRVEVVDFSARVCDELRDRVSDTVAIVNQDILEPLTTDRTFTHVLCDALINRLDDGEARRFERRMARLLGPGGVLRATVKLGHYPMDLRLMEIAAGRPELEFWDESTRTIDYGKLGDLLERGYARHGGIRREDLMGWYQHRGREKRYEESDLRELFAAPAWSRPDVQPEAAGSDRVKLETRRTSP
jgi:SAM-dependent methyltransferase